MLRLRTIRRSRTAVIFIESETFVEITTFRSQYEGLRALRSVSYLKDTQADSAPTDGEMAILRSCGQRAQHGRDVHDVLQAEREVGYTTVLKMLQIMRDKGIVSREDTRRPHIYAAAQERAVVQDGLVAALAESLGGSAASLVMRALSAESQVLEIADIRAFLDTIEPGSEQ